MAVPKKESEVINLPEGTLSGDQDNDPYWRGDKAGAPEPVAGSVASVLLWQAGKQQAQKAFSLYGNIDILRPYFHVEPQEVRDRIFESFLPRWPSNYKALVIPGELYGPLMLVFTLITLLLYGMKSSGHTVKEGTLMGTAFGVSFGYWLGGSALVYSAAYICSTHISFLQVLSSMGYALSGHCVVLILSSAFHPVHSHIFFYVTWFLIGGLTAAKLVSVLVARTSGSSHKILAGGVAASLHLLMLLYAHFAYHRTVEALDQI